MATEQEMREVMMDMEPILTALNSVRLWEYEMKCAVKAQKECIRYLFKSKKQIAQNAKLATERNDYNAKRRYEGEARSLGEQILTYLPIFKQAVIARQDARKDMARQERKLRLLSVKLDRMRRGIE